MTGFDSLGDGERILAVLAILYLWDCACWLPRSAAGFSGRGRNRRLTRPVAFLRNDRGGLVFFDLLPSSELLICEAWPLSLSAEGIHFDASERPPAEPNFRAWHEVRSVESRERELLVNAIPAARCSSAEVAGFLAERLSKIASASPAQRGREIEALLADTTDTDVIAARLAALKTQGLAVRIAATVFFFYTFALGYFLLCVPSGVAHATLIFCGGLVLTWLATVGCFWHAHRSLFPTAGPERRRRIAMMLLLPPEAMRAPAALSRNLLVNFHPLAVAALVCSPKIFRELARSTLLSLNHAAMPRREVAGALSDDPQTSGWFSSRLLHHLAQVVRRAGLEADELLQAPRTDADALSYCPRCHAQFTVPAGSCRDCSDTALIAFVESKART
jgi:hypothetical protein